MNKKTLHDLHNLEGKKALVRVDFNVPIEDGIVKDINRIKEEIPTLEYLKKHGAKLIILSHLGRVEEEKHIAKNNLQPVANKLHELTGWNVKFVNATRGHLVEEAINNMHNGDVVMLQNTRYEDFVNGQLVKNESKNNPELGKYWANLGDIFVNDAFGTAHRAHASNVGIATYIKETALGFLMEKEVSALSKLNNPQRPYVAIMGGAKVADKLLLIENMLKKADKVIVGPALVATFDKAKGKKIGNTIVDDSKIEICKELMNKYPDKLVLTIDYLYAPEFKDIQGHVGEQIPDGNIGMDMGPKSIELVDHVLSSAKTIVWNGPVGVSEFKHFEKGTLAIAKKIASMHGNVYSVIGGGDSAASAIKLGLADKFSHVSTGGGASVEFLEGKILPGIECIQNK